MPGRRRPRRRRSASRRSTRRPGLTWPVSRLWPADRSSRLVPADVSDSFALEEMPSAPLDDTRAEPMPASVAPPQFGPAPPETVADLPPPRTRNRVITPGLFVSLALHLSP